MRMFPEARLVRMDRDTTSRKGSHARIIQSVRGGHADILIGTQMVAKGLDFPRVTLVGVVSADTGLHIPDFRASERTFQTLAQVAGRAGRSNIAGEVVIQTFTPEHYAIECAAKQDYVGYFAKEIEQRRELRYPPFASLANVVATGADADGAQLASSAVAEALRADVGQDCEVIGPAAAALERLKGKYRWHVVLRAHDRDVLPEALSRALGGLPSRLRGMLSVDIDPVSLA
jgi:primosomal protein N' (replication factor Y)